ncbi:MAG: arabinogalactan endo-1 4-beta-galactosidase [Puniceicoccaceae bacterium 5H]|nr:MAG: arabinogalactan endo-1 4-beta-galactosidase [Puniceicoccaceae bacterium 5H]
MSFPAHAPGRRRTVSGCLFGLLALLLSSAGVAAPLPYLYGADVSALPVFEQNGAVYKSADGEPGDALALLHEAGVNVFRLRLFVDPNHEGIVTNDLDYTIALAKRAKATGAALLLDLHYSDTWADPAKQYTPEAWEDLPLGALEDTVEAYTREVMERFIAADVAPEWVQLGNEITNGMLWPIGRVEFAEADDTAAWDRLGALQRAAHRGFAAAFEGRLLPRKILHIESTGNVERTRWYLQNAQAQHVPFDVIGFSYYPEWHGTLDDLQQTLNAAARQTCLPVMVVETAYPWKPDAHWQDVKDLAWPLTPQGQHDFLEAVDAAVHAVPDDLGRGVMWWHPESVQTWGLHAWLGGSCALFDDEGRLLPAASALQP